MSVSLPSQFNIGDPVYVSLQGHDIAGHIRAVLFTSGKARYAVTVPIHQSGHEAEDMESLTTLHNLDSILVRERPGASTMLFSVDNYS